LPSPGKIEYLQEDIKSEQKGDRFMKVSIHFLTLFLAICASTNLLGRCGWFTCSPKAEIPKIRWIKTPQIPNPEDREQAKPPADLTAEAELPETGADNDAHPIQSTGSDKEN
jgi:hypothetical protein